MQVWSFWLESLRATLEWLSTGLGLETGLSIVVLTLLLRLLLLPLSWHSAWRGCLQQKRQRLLQPELIELRERYKDEPAKLVEQTLRLYRARGFAPFELRPLAGALVQMPVLFGMFQVLRGSVEAARFLWVENLARPDFWLAERRNPATGAGTEKIFSGDRRDYLSAYCCPGQSRRRRQFRYCQG
jgi:YidC/Oxa1 family membrane protein insertase